MWKLIEPDQENSKDAAAAELTELLEALPSKIPGIINLKAGIDTGVDSTAYDYVLIVDFDNEQALKEYIVHPDHQAAAKRIKELTTARSAIDLKC